MPDWMQWIVGAAAVATAIGVLAKKVFLPGYRAVGAIEDAVPVLRDVTATFKGNENVFLVLEAIASEFRTDSGSSLRDVVNRLEVAAVENARSAELLKVGVEASRMLAERDRQQQEQLLLLVDRLTTRVDRLMVSGDTVAENLLARERQLDEASAGVASDLAASRQAADDTPPGEAGEAADAASRTPPTAEQ